MAKAFSFVGDVGGRVAKKLQARMENYDRDMERKMDKATTIVWRTATAKRPMYLKEYYGIRVNKDGSRRMTVSRRKVSQPWAKAGVPVQTGALKASIKKHVGWKKDKIIGRIYTDGSNDTNKYNWRIEFGDSKIQPRPFMSPALLLNKPAIKEIFRKQIL